MKLRYIRLTRNRWKVSAARPLSMLLDQWISKKYFILHLKLRIGSMRENEWNSEIAHQ